MKAKINSSQKYQIPEAKYYRLTEIISGVSTKTQVYTFNLVFDFNFNFDFKVYLGGVNFLAHIYLSDDNDLVTIGNFMADGIKGKKYLDYPDEIQRGILLHRWIDSYTDSHPIVKQSTKRLHSKYGHYSGVIVDILYDHFLAKNWHLYHRTALDVYVDHFYQLLKDNHSLLTPRIQKMMIPMMAQNWIVSYATLDGIATVLYNMNIRIKGRVPMDKAIEDLEEHYEAFGAEFEAFFEELRAFAKVKLKEIKV